MKGKSGLAQSCIIDDFIRSAIDEGADTVLNLGAGLDMRLYRMSLPASQEDGVEDAKRAVQVWARRLGRLLQAARAGRPATVTLETCTKPEDPGVGESA